MITEDYVGFETAKLMKEKGFNEPCWNYYYKSNNKSKFDHYFRTVKNNEWTADRISAPTLQMAMKWLREVHHYYIQIMLDSWACGGHMGYYVVIQKTNSDFEMMLQDAVDEVFYETCEQACEAAIKYCLENLI